MTNDVHIKDDFLSPYIKLVRDVMLPYQWDTLNDLTPDAEKSHSIENIRIAAGEAQGEFEGMVFQDSDVAKWLEAAAYCIQSSGGEQHGTGELQSRADEVIRLIAKAQCKDGYFNTYFQLGKIDRRLTNLYEAHELYCLGHFIEAAVAYYEATGKREVLGIFCRYADLIDSLYGEGEGKLKGYPGHQEIELALVKLYEATGERRYLDLASFFINERGKEPHFFAEEWKKRDGLSVWSGRNDPCPKDFSYNQAHKPVREQAEAVGHAVRAVYMYTAMAEIGRLTKDESLLDACRRLFDNICRQLYVTGSIGSTNHGEAFTFAYDMPNEINYSETCASIGLIYFMHSLLKTEMRSAYADVMERALYNTALASIGTDGKTYFYVNPMEVWPEASEKNPARTHVAAQRQKWHRCACCPPNTARLLASLDKYLYTVDEASATVSFHLYASSEFKSELCGAAFGFTVTTKYPLGGEVTVEVKSASGSPVTLAFRLPGWCSGRAVEILVNGAAFDVTHKYGYACVTHAFKPGDIVRLRFDMSPRLLRANTLVRADAGRVCVQRGPIVYCLEECDNGSNLHALLIDSETVFSEKSDNIGGIPCVVLTALGYRETDTDDAVYTFSKKEHTPYELTFIPYHLWGNREQGEMLVWVRELI